MASSSKDHAFVVQEPTDAEAMLPMPEAQPRMRTSTRLGLALAAVLAVVGAVTWSSSRPSMLQAASSDVLLEAEQTPTLAKHVRGSASEQGVQAEEEADQDDSDDDDDRSEAAVATSKSTRAKSTTVKLAKSTRAKSTTVKLTTTESTTAKPLEEIHCSDMMGVILAQDEKKSKNLWPQCAPKWSEDCRSSGCCADWGMKCFEKDAKWAACNTECKAKDEKNETWSCKQIWPPQPRTTETCSAACKDSEGCRQAVYSADNSGSCKLSNQSSTEVVWASDAVNTTVCGTKQALQKMEAKVQEQLPFQLPQQHRTNCSWSGDDCSQTKCCNEYSCTKDFSQCWGYSCYKKSEYFASCMTGTPPESWDGKWIGGAREQLVLPPAGSKAKLMGTSLYCFMVVTWDAPPAKPFWSPERELVDNMKTHGLSIFQCDGHDIYDGIQTEVAEWGSFSNIDAFQQTWKQVKDRGDWKNFDWTVKVDSDAVFLPDRLKLHIEKLRVPEGGRVYLENNFYRFKFMGALEVVSKPALEIWLEESSGCIRGKHEGGEDFFMKGCMDALGIDRMIDHELLHDKYAGQDIHCNDGWAAAFHFHKSVIRWNWCYNELVCGNRGKTCDNGVDVEYVMED